MPDRLYAALVRGINVGGYKMVAMADLRELMADLGFADAHTLLQSGNIVFRSAVKPPLQIERLLETETAKRLDIQAEFFVRTAAELQALVSRNPFRAEASRDPARLVVMFLKQAPDRSGVTALQAAITGRETVRTDGKHAYIVYPDGIGRSRLTGTLIEKKLGTRGTARNWNTVLKLRALANPS
jgi:uncharacterized protein (DUF1697 family)